MFRDTKEELERLEQQLLEEEQESTPSGEAPESPGDFEPFLEEESQVSQGPMVYRNYSNDYGKNLRNYATGYQAYNSDRVDEDLEEFSEAVRSGHKGSPVWLLVILLALMAAVVAAIVWIYLGMGGLL